MKIISMTMWRRPDCAKRVLDALSRCFGIGHYTVLVKLDGDADPALYDVCREFRAAPLTVRASASHRGCNENTHWALNDGFSRADYVIHVEEDVVLSPDALRYFEWAGQFWEDSSIFSVGAWRHGPSWEPELSTIQEPSQEHANKVSRCEAFHIWGWATWRDRWKDMNNHWTTGKDLDSSWDTVLSDYRRMSRKVELVPLVSRAQNIGEGGVHRGAARLNVWAGDFESCNEFAIL